MTFINQKKNRTTYCHSVPAFDLYIFLSIYCYSVLLRICKNCVDKFLNNHGHRKITGYAFKNKKDTIPVSKSHSTSQKDPLIPLF